jgi:hypothetical protein
MIRVGTEALHAVLAWEKMSFRKCTDEETT